MNEKQMELQKQEKQKREKLKREKPLVFEKILKIKDRLDRGIPTPMVDIAYSYLCNLHCKHCMVSRMAPKKRKLDVAMMRSISDQAHAFGLCQFTLSGGEPLILKELDDVIAAMQPDKFHLSMSTNGHFLTEEKALHLKKIGLDKVKVSIDDFDEKLHDRNRENAGAYQKAIAALFNAQKAGLNVVIQTVVSHQNCKTDRTLKMAEFAQKNGFSVDVMLAKAVGQWEGKHEVLIDDSDMEYLKQVHETYSALHLDTFPTYGIDRGCGTVNSLLQITQYGDVLPCGFIQISLGNLFEESLADILARGMRIRHFGCYHKKCLSGHDREFIEQYMTKFYGKPLPINWCEAFGEEDFIQ
ncbi:MAG: Cyclic pyranopterin monophosphate synthase [Lentisphaerae bacterium ADurb.Bin242]|nr:MAG: Cyclic pyranopterin monophosphate synthase [Lentisphaerae bacterium ADurb.Bin242]